MGAYQPVRRLFMSLQSGVDRFRYPFSMPEDIGRDLGVDVTNRFNFDTFLEFLCSPTCLPRNLKRYMPRQDVEEMFSHAFRTERFPDKTRFSYYFNKRGWVMIELRFNNLGQLRRLFLQSPNIPEEGGLEIRLLNCN